MPISVSNVAFKDAKTGKPVRIGYVIEGEGKQAKKVRDCTTEWSKDLIGNEIIIWSYENNERNITHRTYRALKEELGYTNVMQAPRV
jgi:hypothetical protein